MAKVDYKSTYSIKIESLNYNDVSYLRKALSEKKDNDGILKQPPPVIFNEIVEICGDILEKEKRGEK